MQNLNFNSFLKRSNYHRPLIFNSVLWSLAFVILLFVFSKGKTPITVDYIYTIIFLLVVAIPVSINFYVLMPRFLKLEKYGLYFILFIINLIVFAALASLLFQPLLDILFPNYFFVSYLSNINIYITYSIFLVATTLLKLAEDWFYFNTNQNRILRLQNQQIQTQLSALRSQVNPHFLFNSLNVIYALALEKKDNLSTAIVELSDVLRYVIYDSNTERVTLKDELKLLQNYTAFQKHRFGSVNIIDFNINIENKNFKIYPMLLLPLLENAYKYGISVSENANPITVTVFQKKSEFEFSILNSKENNDSELDKNYSGVGLKTLQDNLNLVYPKQHQFNIVDTKTNFKVTIKITDVQA